MIHRPMPESRRLSHPGAVGLLLATLAAAPAAGQGFDAVLNVPPDPAPGAIGSNTQLNLHDGGRLPAGFDFGPRDQSGVNIEANILGGTTGTGINAFAGSTVNVLGGRLGDFFVATTGSTVNVAGGALGDAFFGDPGVTVNLTAGSVGRAFDVDPGAVVTLTGGAFRLGDTPVDGPTEVPRDTLLTGTLTDGSVVIFLGQIGDVFSPGTLTLVGGQAPAPGPSLIHAPADPAPRGLRAGQTLVLGPGAQLRRDFGAVDAVLRIEGGAVADGLEVARTAVELTAGSIGRNFDAHAGSTVTIRGGSVGDGLRALPGSRVTLVGGEFRLGESPVAGDVELPPGAVLTGTLADGSVVIFSSEADHVFAPGTLGLEAGQAPPPGPALVALPASPAPVSLRPGQTLRLDPGGAVGDGFNAAHAVIRVQGGAIGDNLQAAHTRVELDAGTLGDHARAFAGTELLITGGHVGDGLDALPGSTVTLAAGSVGQAFSAHDQSTVTLTGGTVGQRFRALSGSTVTLAGGSLDGLIEVFAADLTLTGGTLGPGFRAGSGSRVHLVGSGFTLDGEPILGLSFDQPLEITDRAAGLMLRGALADGSPIALELDPALTAANRFARSAALLLSLAPLPGDLDGDGFVGAADLDRLLGLWNQSVTPGSPGDLTADGFVGAGDLDVLLAHWNAGAPPAAAVPEPATVGGLLLLAGWSWFGRGREIR